MDHLADTAFLGRHWCPTCEPNVDPTREILETRYCGMHTPPVPGLDDGIVGDIVGMRVSGSVESGGADNRRWCALIHSNASSPPHSE